MLIAFFILIILVVNCAASTELMLNSNYIGALALSAVSTIAIVWLLALRMRRGHPKGKSFIGGECHEEYEETRTA